MDQFKVYFELGLEHILDINGYDHILFVIALCSIYMVRDWKRILILITAFTIGHSVTLALSTLDLIKFDTKLIEFLIPVTIFITAFANLFYKKQSAKRKKVSINYIFALFFGLIHGLGFSNYLKSILGKAQSVFQPLLAFNLGIELGQLVIVLIFMSVGWIIVRLMKVSSRDWNLVVSAAVAGIALTMIFGSGYLN